MNTDEQKSSILRLLRACDGVEAAWLFGSVAHGTADRTSDLDVAVLDEEPLPAHSKMHLVETLAQVTGRPVDLIDLKTTRGPIVGRVLQKGIRLFCNDTTLYANLLRRWWFDQADWLPYRRRILKERRKQWIES